MPCRAPICAAVMLMMVVVPAHAQAPTGPPLNAKLAETLMGPRTQRIYMSDDGDHLAIVAPKGSREIVLIDGVEGPVFDEIPANFAWSSFQGSGGSIAFSPTGGHSAYVGRRAGDFIAVVDGKEAVTLMNPATQQGVSYSDPAGWGFWFNHDGSHLAYAALGGPASWVMVFDGVKSPDYHAFDLRQAALNGNRFVYVAQTADQKWHVVVDGKPGPAYNLISNLKLTPDGAHYAYIANRAGVGAVQAVAVVDGVESPPNPGISDLELAPDGRVAYMAISKPGSPMAHGGGSADLVVGSLHIPATTTFGVTIRTGYSSSQNHIAWSPDGKRFAYVQNNTPNPGVTVMVSGKPMGPTYQTANELVWSPDGSRFAYQGVSPTGTFPVVDGQELSGYHWIKDFRWSPDGKRYAFQAASSTGISMVVDGKEGSKARSYVDGSLQFSPDSKHLAYGAQSNVLNFQPVVDGVPKPYNLQSFATRNNPPITFPVFSFSPDANHLAYVAFTTDATPKGGVIVDGTLYQGPTVSFEFPSWSPNSKHFAAVSTTGKGWTVMVDGKLSPYYEDMLATSMTSCRFVDDHTFRFYGIKAGQIYRVTLDLGT